MAFPERNLNQICVYWASPVSDGYGTFTWTTPVEIPCRWMDSNKVIVNKDGVEIVTQAEVQVAQALNEQGILYLGKLADLTDAQKSNPKLKDGTRPILRFDVVPTMKGTKFFRKAYL